VKTFFLQNTTFGNILFCTFGQIHRAPPNCFAPLRLCDSV